MTTSGRKAATSEDRHLARAAAAAFGGSAKVHKFYDRDESHEIAILTCTDAPQPAFSTYSTIGAHRAPNRLENENIPVELAGVASAAVTEFPNMLATAAFQVIKEGWLAAPGVVFPGLVSDYALSDTLEHVMWTPPFPWPDLHRVTVSDKLNVHWLLAVPIAESERRLLANEGYPALERLLEQNDTAYYDLDRDPVV